VNEEKMETLAGGGQGNVEGKPAGISGASDRGKQMHEGGKYGQINGLTWDVVKKKDHKSSTGKREPKRI